MYTINDSKIMAANQANSNIPIRVLKRILDWKVLSVLQRGLASEAENAQKDLQSVKLDMATSLPTDTDFVGEDPKSIADRHDEVPNEIIDASSNKKSDEFKGCAAPRRILVKIQLAVIDFNVYNDLITANVNSDASFQGRRDDLNIGISDAGKEHIAKFTKKNILYHPAVTRYEIAFNTNEFIDFNLDPDKIALEVTANATPSLADPKLIAYSEDTRYAVPGTISEQEPRATQNLIDTTTSDIKSLITKVKDKLTDKGLSKAEKEVIRRIETKGRTINSGTAYIEIKSLDPNQEKATITPGEDGVRMGTKMAGLNLSKEYENASKKIKYAMAPFSMDYKGWKPNLLGKYFASDSTIGVKTWKQNLGPYGEELVKIATSIGALKAFQFAIKETGIKDRLEEATRKLEEREKVGSVSKDSTIIANEGYNASTSGTSAFNDISRFTRK